MMMMKRHTLILWILLCGFAFLPATRSAASHAAGGELIYEWVSDSTYRFYFKFYRACSGIAEPTSLSMCYYNSCNNNRGTVTLTKVSILPGGVPNGSEVSPGCPGYATNCQGGTAFPGYREWWYTGLVTLPSRCAEWICFISISSRNTSTNINTGLLYIEATLNNIDGAGNSSPYFSVKPVPYVCINTPYTYNNGAVDPDNDSLTFEFIQPRTVSGSCATTPTPANIAFRSNFTLNNPFATNNTFSFDAATGMLEFTPAAISTNTVTVRVNEFRNGRKIGSVMRDIQIQVLACNVAAPSVSVVGSTVSGAVLSGNRIEGFANQPLRFCYSISASGAATVLVATDNHAVSAPGSSVTYAGQPGNPVTGCFSWQPSCSDTGLKIFTVTVKDTTCAPPGIILSQTFTIPLYIRSGLTTSKNLYLCRGDSVRLNTTGNLPATWSVLPGGDDLSSLSCTHCNITTASPGTRTTYVARSEVAGCSYSDYITVRVEEEEYQVSITPASPYTLCQPGYIDLDVTTTGAKPFSNLPCGPVISSPGTSLDTAIIVPRHATAQSSTNPASTPFGGGTDLSSRRQYLIRAADLRASGMYSGTMSGMTFYISAAASDAVFEGLQISLTCTDLNDLDPTSGFVPGATPVYTAAGPVFFPSAGGHVTFDFDMLYSWDTTRNLLVDICYTNNTPAGPAYTTFYNAGYQSTLYGTAATGSICGAAAGTVYATHELPAMTFQYYQSPEAAFSYRWENGIFLPSAVTQSPRVYAGVSNTFYVYTRSRHGCLLGDSLSVLISEGFTLNPQDTAICAGDFIRFRAAHGTQYRWYEDDFNQPATLSCNDCPDPVATPLRDTRYTVIASDSLGCMDTLSATIKVYPVPEVRILTGETTVGYNRSIQLEASGADRYTWSPPAGLDNSGVYNPVAVITKSVVYTVKGSKGDCHAYDSVRIYVDYQQQDFFIPSAFTPNGDSRNDLFRIRNLQGRKLQEFRVFNRWGQELFYTTDENAGWDGAHKGVPQEAGVYHYLIYIANPDGTGGMYKGDVTLVR